jgi:hypothetical protein
VGNRKGGATTKNISMKDADSGNLVEAYHNEFGSLSLKIKIPEGDKASNNF